MTSDSRLIRPVLRRFKKSAIVMVAVIPLILCLLSPAQGKLTDPEKAWLEEHQDIRLGVDPAWPPFEFFDASRVYSGVASDYVRRLNQELDINMVPVSGLSWAKVVEMTKKAQIDVLSCVMQTDERSKYLLFTEPYMSFPVVIMTREDAPFVISVNDFGPEKAAVVKGYVTQEFLERDYPKQKLYLAKNIEEALKALSKGKVDAYVGNLAVITYTIQRLGLDNLKVATATPYHFELGFGVRKDWPELVTILNRTIKAIPESEKKDIQARWINVRFERDTNWALLIQVIIAVVLLGGILLSLILKWNRKLAREVSERKEAEKALQKEKDFIETVINSIPDAISIIDIDTGRIVEANEAFITEVGLPWEEIEGGFCYDVTHNLKEMCGPPYHECPMLKTSETGQRQATEHIHHDSQGNEIYAEVSTFPIKDENGAFTQVVHVARDITERRKAEELIHDSEERLTQIINFLPDPTWVVDNEGKVVIWNRALETLTGSKAEDMVGKGNYEYALPLYGERRLVLIDLIRDWSDEYEKEYLSIKKEGGNLISESFHPDLGDGDTYLLATAGLLYDAAGETTGAIESLRDITAMKGAEIELRKLSRAIEQSPTAVVMTDLSGTIEYVNPKFTGLTGYSAEEAVGQNPRVLKSGKHPQEYYEDLWNTILSGKAWRGEFCNRKKNGDLFWEYASISPVRNSKGELTHFVAVKEDITDRKQMEQELIEAKEAADEANRAKGDFLANMSHEIRTPMNAVIGMSHLALKTELTTKQRDYLNKIQSSANALLGIINDILDFSKIEAGKLDMESVDFNLDDVLENVGNLVTVRAQKKETLEVLFSTASSVPRFLKGDPLRLSQVLINLSNNAVKFTDSGEIVITTQVVKENEDQFTLQFSVSDTGVGLSQEQISRLFQAFSQADTSTTRKFGGTGLGLTISKRLVEMMAGKIWVESEPGKGSTFIFTAVFGRGSEKEKKQLMPSADLRGLKVLVVDDNATSRNIFQEMLESFTFKTTLAASGEEGLEELEKAPEDDPFRLVIMDWQMPGLDGIEASERIRKMFLPEEQPAIVMVTAYGREEIMQKVEQTDLDGFLIKPVSPSVLFDTIMQALGEGVVRQPTKPTAAEAEVRVLDMIRGARILLVEDNEINRQVAGEILKGAELEVSTANNGQEAIDALQETVYDAVLMDVQMPVMDGYKATRKLRGDPRFKDLPIIAMTAHAMAGDREKSLEAGMNDHVTKPIDPVQLFSTLARWIQSVSKKPSSAIPKLGEPDRDKGEKPLPELSGIQFEKGLVRLGGNRDLFEKLLLQFRDSHRDAAIEIKTALEEDDVELAARLAHTVKGVAANLGAEDLSSSAGELEKEIKGGNARPEDSVLIQFGMHLNEVLEGLEAFGPEETVEEQAEAEQDQATSVDRDTVGPLLVEVAGLLESDLIEAMNRLEALGEQLGTSSLGDAFKQLVNHVEGFDTDSAMKSLEHIAQTLNMTLKEDEV